MSRIRKPKNTVDDKQSDYPNLMNVSWEPVSRRIFPNFIFSEKFKVVISPDMLSIRQIGRKSSMVVGSVGFALFVFCLMFQILRDINELTIIGTFASVALSLNLYGGLHKREVATFNKDNGMYWLGRESSKSSINLERRVLSAISALQITDTLFPDGESTHLYEINIVFHDISRENILKSTELD